VNSALAAEGYFRFGQHSFRSLFIRAAGFQTRENALCCNDRAFSPGENAPSYAISPSAYFSHRSHALYQGTTLVGP
jgi:hypothetical protein